MGAPPAHPIIKKTMKKTIISVLIIIVIIGGYFYLNSNIQKEAPLKISPQETVDKMEGFNETVTLESISGVVTEEGLISEIETLEDEEYEIDAMISELEELSF